MSKACRRSERTRLSVAASFCRLTLAGLAGLTWLAGCAEQQSQGGFAPPPMPVETARVTVGSVVDQFTAVGTIEADESVTVTPEIDGVIVAVPFREGAAIGRGEMIARLDDIQLAAEVDRARALREQSEVTYQRIKSVVDQGAGAPQDLDNAAATLKVAAANLALAEARLAKTRIVAPFAGVVGARRVSPGAFVRAGEPITDLAKIDRLRVTFSAPERILGQLHQGAPVRVSTTAFPDRRLQGVIDVIEPQLDPNTRSAGIVALVDNPSQLFRPGMSATINVVLNERSQAMTIPSEAVFVEGGLSLVYAVKSDSTVTRTAVETGTRLDATVEILDGLEPDQIVVRAGHQKLYEGAKVMPITSQPGAAAGQPPGEAPAAATDEAPATSTGEQNGQPQLEAAAQSEES